MEKMIWDYIEEESNELVLKVQEMVAQDGFTASMPDQRSAPETLALKIMSAAMVKTLAILVEKLGHTNLAMAYMQTVPMHVEYVKELTIRGMREGVE